MFGDDAISAMMFLSALAIVETGFGRGLSRGLVGKATLVSMVEMQGRRRIKVELGDLERRMRVSLKMVMVYQ